jgi:hypothetical protein
MALLAVLLTLLALLVLCTPFLLTARNASTSSTLLADRSQAQLSLDAATRHARAVLGQSHPSRDTTPDSDSAEELFVDNEFDPSFWNPSDPKSAMWDLESTDLAGRIDLNSASPHVVANLFGGATRLSEECEVRATQVQVASAEGFPPQGFVWIGPELVSYAERTPTALTGLTRAVASGEDADGKPLPCGPQPEKDHVPGTPVLDQKAFAPALWRMATPDGELRRFSFPEELVEAGERFAIAGAFPREVLEALSRATNVYSGTGEPAVWQRPSRLMNSIRAGEDCRLQLDEVRYFNHGTTVAIDDGRTREFGLVLGVENQTVVLFDPVANDYDAFSAVVEPLARLPVNANTASPFVLEALFANLQWNGVNARITGREARELASLVVEQRPFDGHEDFLRRVVLPAAGIEPPPADSASGQEAPAFGSATGGFIDRHDALALYANALNSNDSGLLFSTMPLCFVSRDLYALELRSAVNAPSGAERVAMLREAVEVIVPQGDLLALWARQQDFDEALRIGRMAPFWMSGPNATSHWDGGATPPSRLWPHLGTHNDLAFLPGVTPELELPDGEMPPDAGVHTFASREDDGYIQLWPSRVAEVDDLAGRILHFDHETRDPEGRYAPDEPVVRRSEDRLIGWKDRNGVFLRPIDLSMWFKPRDLTPGILLDVGTTSLQSDRITLAIEEDDLVLRVLDAAGAHPESLEGEGTGELRYALAPGDGPGLQEGTWSHVSIDVRGNAPELMTMLVDGRSIGVRAMGLSSLDGPLPDGTATLALESSEGFPEIGVARVGDELIEYRRIGDTLEARHETTGRLAGFGGRVAREIIDYQNGVPVNSGLDKDTTHPGGAAVAHYGYSLPLRSNAPTGEGRLSGELGVFAAFRVTGVSFVGDPDVTPGPGQRIIVHPNFDLGLGIDGDAISLLELAWVDCPGGSGTDSPCESMTLERMACFSPGGGYALLMQENEAGYRTLDGRSSSIPPITTSNVTLGGYEIVRYGGVEGTTLQILERGVRAPGETNSSVRAFVIDWENVTWSMEGFAGDPGATVAASLFLIPISIEVPGADALAAFLPPQEGSEIAQITHIDQAELTEWVRYDQIDRSFLVRNHPDALQGAFLAATPYQPQGIYEDPGTGGGGGGNTGGGQNTGGVSVPRTQAMMVSAAPPPSPQPAGAAAQTNDGADSGLGSAYWLGVLGVDELGDAPISRSIGEAFQFRGVLGTFSHRHPAGSTVLPVFRVWRQTRTPATGWPGRLDQAFLVDSDTADPGWPVTVHLSRIPFEHRWEPWRIDPGNPAQGVASGEPNDVMDQGIDLTSIFVGLQQQAPVPIAAGDGPPCSGAAVPADVRCKARLIKFPSGELPRIAETVVLGASIQGGEIPAVTIDEAVFGSAEFGQGTDAEEQIEGARMILTREEISEEAMELFVQPNAASIAGGEYLDPTKDFLDDLPSGGGLLRIGEEILAYESRDPDGGTIQVAPGGRGLLGTLPRPHEPSASVTWLERFDVAMLAADIGADDATLPLEDAEGFPPSGTVLIGDELIHYTRLRENAIEMPRFSRDPGERDEEGGGIFRGRFGTQAAAHSAGDAVVLFPFRYWDRWADRADAPELAYFRFALRQPAAFWRSVFWDEEQPSSGGCAIEVLQRTDPSVPWDADPEGNAQLKLLVRGMHEDAANPIGVQRDFAEWRAFVRYAPLAFDAQNGLSHAWKQTPRLKLFGVEYLAPYVALRRVDR